MKFEKYEYANSHRENAFGFKVGRMTILKRLRL